MCKWEAINYFRFSILMLISKWYEMPLILYQCNIIMTSFHMIPVYMICVCYYILIPSHWWHPSPASITMITSARICRQRVLSARPAVRSLHRKQFVIFNGLKMIGIQWVFSSILHELHTVLKYLYSAYAYISGIILCFQTSVWITFKNS